MALPSNPTSSAGVSNRVVSVAGTSGYTGVVSYGAGVTQYLISDPAADYVNANSGTVGQSNLNYSSTKQKQFGLPKLSGLDKALGALGGAVAAYGAVVGSFNAALDAGAALAAGAKQLGATFKNIGKKLPQIPEGPKGTYATTKIAKSDWRVKLNTNWDILQVSGQRNLLLPLAETDGMVFPYLPNINVTHRANYTSVDPIHNNFSIQGYKGSTVEDITITGEFSVDSQTEGEYWIAATTFLKTVTKMFYGQSKPSGNPPLVCRLSGYGKFVFDDIPVVVKNYQVEFKDGVQYKKISIDQTFTWVPVLSTITVVVSPVYNRESLRRFDLQNYANGLTSGVL
jgi:hypothetical protein